MCKLYLFFIACVVFINTNGQTYKILKDPLKGNNIYEGFITDSLLKADSSCKWFGDAQRIFTPKDNVVAAFKQNKDSVRFLIFMGTWCDDSHFVIPRFFNILEAAGYDKTKLTMVGVDRHKKEVTNLSQILNITNVPTIIAFKNGRELGRVVEYGSTGRFDEEITTIILGKKADVVK